MNIVNSILNGEVIAETSYPIAVKLVRYQDGKTALIYTGNGHTFIQSDLHLWLDGKSITPNTAKEYEVAVLDNMAKLGYKYEEVTNDSDGRLLKRPSLLEEESFFVNANNSVIPFVQYGCLVYKSECGRYVETLSPKRTVRTYHVGDKVMLVNLISNFILIKDPDNDGVVKLDMTMDTSFVEIFSMLYTWCNELTEK